MVKKIKLEKGKFALVDNERALEALERLHEHADFYAQMNNDFILIREHLLHKDSKSSYVRQLEHAFGVGTALQRDDSVVEEMVDALKQAALTFRTYEHNHNEKTPPDATKAWRNRKEAEMCEAVIQKFNASRGKI